MVLGVFEFFERFFRAIFFEKFVFFEFFERFFRKIRVFRVWFSACGFSCIRTCTRFSGSKSCPKIRNFSRKTD